MEKDEDGDFQTFLTTMKAISSVLFIIIRLSRMQTMLYSTPTLYRHHHQEYNQHAAQLTQRERVKDLFCYFSQLHKSTRFICVSHAMSDI